MSVQRWEAKKERDRMDGDGRSARAREMKRNAPLIHDGILAPPVKNPMRSFVKELQLKSTRESYMYHKRAAACTLMVIYPRDDTGDEGDEMR
jgi:hypothetical protein